MAEASMQLWSEAFYRAVDPQVRSVGLMAAEAGKTYTPSRSLLGDVDLWYTAKGRGRVLVDEEWVDFAEGDLVVLRPGEYYREDQADRREPFEHYFVHFYPLGDRLPAVRDRLMASWPRRLSFAYYPALGGLFAELFETWTARAEGSELRAKSLMLRILELVFARLRHETGEPLPPAWPKLMRARDYIIRHHCGDLTLEEIAEAADLSASYLLTLFRRHLGRSPIRYQTELRLRRARVLLARGMAVGEVARETGFSSLHYFSRTFRRHVGMPPSAFAERCRRR